MSEEIKNNDELSFEERLSANFGDSAGAGAASATTEKLREVNKKLPKWDLEPPMDFIK